MKTSKSSFGDQNNTLNYFTPKKKTIHNHNHDPNLIKESLNLELEEKSKNSLHPVMLLGVKRNFSLESD